MENKKNPGLAFALVAVICLASACVESKPADTGFIGGKEGLAISFQSIPSEIMERSQLPTTLLIENKGEADISASDVERPTAGAICIGGPLLDETGQRLNKIEYITELKGAKKIAGSQLPGGQKIINFIAKAPDVQGDTQATLSATARYMYWTTGQASACIPAASVVAQTLGQQACQPNELKPVSSSAAPVQIAEVREISSPSEGKVNLIFLIKVKNVGGGMAYDSSTGFSGCVPIEDPLEHMNRVDIWSAQIGISNPIKLKCENPILLVDNEGSTTCQGAAEAPSAYEEPLYIKLLYAYTQLATQKLTIRNIN